MSIISLRRSTTEILIAICGFERLIRRVFTAFGVLLKNKEAAGREKDLAVAAPALSPEPFRLRIGAGFLEVDSNSFAILSRSRDTHLPSRYPFQACRASCAGVQPCRGPAVQDSSRAGVLPGLSRFII